MISHLLGIIGCAFSLGVSLVGASKNIDNRVNIDNDSSSYLGGIHEYQTYTFLSTQLESANLRTRFYYDYDINTNDFTFVENLDFSYPITLSTPSSIFDYDTILSNYIAINKVVSSSNYTSNNDLCVWFVLQDSWVYRIVSYNPDTFANFGYLEYFDCTNGGHSNFSLVDTTDISGFSNSESFNYTDFSNSTNYGQPFYSYFDRQPYGCFSRIFYVSTYTLVHYTDLSLDLRIDFDLYGLPQSYSTGYFDGYSNGNQHGYINGYNEGKEIGYSEGYTNGFNDGTPMQLSFLGLFGAIADTPVFIIRNLFSFEIFGINVLAVFMSLLTALLVLHFIRKLL